MNKLYISLFILFWISPLMGFSQTKKFNEFNVELLGHSLGLGANYKRTLDVSYMNEFHGLFSAGITNGMFSSYAGFGYRRGDLWFVEFEALGGYNSLYGLRRERGDLTQIRSGMSFGAHVNFGTVTFDDYSARLTIGWHVYQSNYQQFILGMTVGRLF